jgi:hypothetical protein
MECITTPYQLADIVAFPTYYHTEGAIRQYALFPYQLICYEEEHKSVALYVVTLNNTLQWQIHLHALNLSAVVCFFE